MMTSALEGFLNVMRYINPRFTYLFSVKIIVLDEHDARHIECKISALEKVDDDKRNGSFRRHRRCVDGQTGGR